MSTITRNSISINFRALDLNSNETFDRSNLESKIDIWKAILRYQCNAKPQESIVIGAQTLNIDYFAQIYAAAELSLKIVIIDYIRSDKFKDLNFIDPKTKVLSPIDIFLHDFPLQFLKDYSEDFAKFNFFTNCSSRTYSTVDDINYDISKEQLLEVSKIKPSKDDILIRATSSGTTSTPKVIEHTHEFIHAVSQRNSSMYKGTALHVKNLNHGASAAVTLFPVIMNDNVTQHLIYAIDEDSTLDNFVEAIADYKDELEYTFFPYPYLADKFIASSKSKNLTWPKLNMVTLSYILDSHKEGIRDGIFKSIISIFGSTETIGPVVRNIIDKDSWEKDPRYFEIVDDFYKIKLYDDGKIGITPPVYNTETITNDYFVKEGNYLIHQGRSDLVRINGEHINLSTINKFNKENINLYVVIDTLNHCLYIALWEDLDESTTTALKLKVESMFTNVKVNKISHLDKNSFYYGIKIDNELLREHFRNHID
jgi:hypothetical protein